MLLNNSWLNRQCKLIRMKEILLLLSWYFLEIFFFCWNIYSDSFIAYKDFFGWITFLFLLDSILIFVEQHRFCWTASSFLLDRILIFVEQHSHFCWTESSFLLNNILIFIGHILIIVEQHPHFCQQQVCLSLLHITLILTLGWLKGDYLYTNLTKETPKLNLGAILILFC